MGQPAPYLFDQAFALTTDGQPERDLIEASVARDQIAAARQEGFEAGRNAGRAEAASEAESHLAKAIDQMMSALPGVIEQADADIKTTEQASIELAVLAARKLARALITREPLAEITELLRESLGDLRSAPHVVVRVNDTLAEALEQRVRRLAAEAGIPDRIIVLGEPEIAPGDGRIEWADGGIVRRLARIERGIDDAVARYVGDETQVTAMEDEDG